MIELPDFRGLFFTSLGGRKKKVRFAVRDDSNRLHDLVFLASLVHGARFRASDCRVHRRALTLPLRRYCWELGIRPSADPDRAGLLVTTSSLFVAPVLALEWRLLERECLFEEYFEIESIFPAEDFWAIDTDNFTLVLTGHTWQVRILTSHAKLRLTLTDKRSPTLACSDRGEHRPPAEQVFLAAEKLAARFIAGCDDVASVAKSNPVKADRAREVTGQLDSLYSEQDSTLRDDLMAAQLDALAAARDNDDEPWREYDFTGGVRGKYARRFAEGNNVVVLDPDVASRFPDAKAVNDALRRIAPGEAPRPR